MVLVLCKSSDCISFCESTSMGFRVIERTWFVMDRHTDRHTDIHTDRQTDRQTTMGKTICLLYNYGRRNNNTNKLINK